MFICLLAAFTTFTCILPIRISFVQHVFAFRHVSILLFCKNSLSGNTVNSIACVTITHVARVLWFALGVRVGAFLARSHFVFSRVQIRQAFFCAFFPHFCVGEVHRRDHLLSHSTFEVSLLMALCFISNSLSHLELI